MLPLFWLPDQQSGHFSHMRWQKAFKFLKIIKGNETQWLELLVSENWFNIIIKPENVSTMHTPTSIHTPMLRIARAVKRIIFSNSYSEPL